MLQLERQIEVVLNGQRVAISAETLADLVAEQGFSKSAVATAVNGHFVAVAQRASTRLAAGDRVELVSARQGG